MPTGYTAGILDGTTKDFNQFAKICSRAFLVHLRDEPMNSEYTPRTPSEYHIDKIKEAKDTLKEIDVLEDFVIIEREKKGLMDDIEYHTEAIKTAEKNKIRLNKFLKKAKTIKAPTETHTGVVDFMIKQLEETIDFDCKDGSYHEDAISELKEKLEVLNVDDIRGVLRIKATENISYNTKSHEEDLKRCRESNKWYDDFINSL